MVLRLSEDVNENLDVDENLDIIETQGGAMVQYEVLAKAILESGNAIDKYYRQENNILSDFDLNTFFSFIKPSLFNFVVLSTLSRRERNQIFKHPNLPLWLRGEDYLLETYNAENVNSQRLFSKRVFLCLGKNTSNKPNWD